MGEPSRLRTAKAGMAGELERPSPPRSRRGSGDGMPAQISAATREAPLGGSVVCQPEACEGRAGWGGGWELPGKKQNPPARPPNEATRRRAALQSHPVSGGRQAATIALTADRDSQL